MSFYDWGPKPTVAERRRTAEKLVAKLGNKGGLSPVVIEGRKIATSFWGKAWCDNLESYSDFENRLPRGRSYVRNSCVIDLQIGKSEITAQVSGSSLYKIRITVAPLDAKTWSGIRRDCAASIDSMVELLQGRLSKAVMDRVCRLGDGLFPTPKAIKLSCSCPDGAYMCKHVAATLYGVGVRLDSRPELLFVLRGVDQQELIASASEAPIAAAGKASPKSGKVLGGADLSALFGLDIEATAPDTEKKRTVEAKTVKRSASDRRERQHAPKHVSRAKARRFAEHATPKSSPGKGTRATRAAKSRVRRRNSARSTSSAT